MIDKENEIYTRLKKALTKKFPNVKVSATKPTKTVFPHVLVTQISRMTPYKYIDSGNDIKYTKLTFDITVSSNKQTGSLQEVRNIMNVIHDELYKMNFRCVTEAPLDVGDNIACRVARFTGVASENEFYRG